MFKIDELLKATGGSLLQAGAETPVIGISTDTRTLKKGEAFIAIKGDNFNGQDFIDQAVKKKAAAIILSSGFRVQGSGKKKIAVIKVKDAVKALGDIAAFHRDRFDIPVIAVTGSNGKTTTKEMLSWMVSLKYKVLKNEGTKNNHIGLPQALLGLDNSHQIAILEIGTNHFGEVAYLAKICRPTIGLITNIGPSHLQHFNDLKGVLKEKSSLLKFLESPRIAVLNADDVLLRGCLDKKDLIGIGFGLVKKTDFSASKIIRTGGKTGFLVNGKHRFLLNSPGLHNIYNSLAAIAVARIFSIGYKELKNRMIKFEFPKGRLKMGRLGQAKVIDDTYNSNPASLRQALNTLDNFKTRGRKIFIMGDMMELGEKTESFHHRIADGLKDICDIFISVGSLSRLTADSAGKDGFDRRNIFRCQSSLKAREILFKEINLRKDDVVLVKGSRRMKMEEILK